MEVNQFLVKGRRQKEQKAVKPGAESSGEAGLTGSAHGLCTEAAVRISVLP